MRVSKQIQPIEYEALPIRFPQDYLYLARKHWRLIGLTLAASVGTAAALIAFIPKRYEATSHILIEQPSGGSMLGNSQGGALLSDMLGTPSASSLETQVEIVKSRPQLEKTMQKLNIKEEPEEFAKRITVQHPKLTEILEVTASADTAQGAADIANTLSDVYEQFVHDRHHRETSSTAGDVKRRLEETEVKLHKLNSQSLNWLKTHHYAAPDAEFGEILKNRLALESENLQSKWGTLSLLEQRAALLREIKKQAPFVEAGHQLGVSSAIDELTRTLSALEIKRANALIEYQPNQPEVKSIDVQIAQAKIDLKNKLKKSISDDLVLVSKDRKANPLREDLVGSYTKTLFDLKSRESRQKAVDAILPRLRQKTLSFPSEAQGLRDLNRRQAATATVWSMLMNKYEELKVREYAAAMRTQVIESATPPIKTARPRPVLYTVMGLLFGIILSAVGVALTESLDRRVYTAWDTERWLGLTTLSVFPKYITNADRQAISNGRIQPAARALLGQLALNGAGSDWRVLSVVPVDEKADTSALAAALAVAASESGLRVMLVDTRIQSNRLEMYFPEETIEENDAPQIVPAPAQEGWLARINDWRDRTDLVIVDTSPLFGAPEACIAAKMAERILPVVHAGTRAAVCEEGCLSMLSQVESKIVGVALIGKS